jgi:predicted DsbA family dithiol-disulfide isomerase
VDWHPFDEPVFEALWVDGRGVGDVDVLADVAESVGLDAEEIRNAVEHERFRERVREKFADARQRGITGVPTFVYGEHVARGCVTVTESSTYK